MLLPAVLITITLHELAHGYVAYLLGDDTAKQSGRLSFNPLAHLDIIGFICMLFAGIGWAKPVPISPYKFKMKNKKLGMAITAFAGPFANLLISFFCLLMSYAIYFTSQSAFLFGLSDFLYITAMLSAGLMAFNLLPIPPLDGSKIVLPLLPNKIIGTVYKYEGVIRFVLMFLLFIGTLDGAIESVRGWILDRIIFLVSAILNIVGII